LVDINRDNTLNLTPANTCMCVLCVSMHRSMCLKQHLIFLMLALSRRRPYTYRHRHTHIHTNIHTPTPLHQFTCTLTHALPCGILLGVWGCVQGSQSRSRFNVCYLRKYISRAACPSVCAVCIASSLRVTAEFSSSTRCWVSLVLCSLYLLLHFPQPCYSPF